ncbi:hypothetical protein L3X38_039570 [Prunus dulcis]|uniref:Uncharacterized protein n=1 Tax=Prunus dulcis TaxID=3755 RepID=A0AAD4V9I7_PRUDU|nr:hypothetical protein L3X38_039570 [Prunus dulcis]
MADEEVRENIEDSPEFKLFLSMKRYLEFRQAVQNDRDSAEDDQRHSNAQAILRYSESVKTQMWVQLEAKLIILMDINKISLPGNLVQPQSYQDFDVLVFLLRYVHTAPDQRCSLPTPLARSISPTWTGWFMQKGVS